MNSCVAIVVTYNRLQLLKENIASLLNQSMPCDVLVIDNASSDGTKAFMAEVCKKNKNLYYKNTVKNLGGAGGFSFGISLALKRNYKYLWVMDDDSIPEKDALDSLMRKASSINDEFSFLASLVYWTDDKLFRMNTPFIIWNKNNELDNLSLLSEKKLLEINSCSFVGCFMNSKYVKEVGLPISEFFIYGDDTEYTTRLVKKEKAYLDIDSKIIHKAPSNKGADIVWAAADRIDRFYYQSRNAIYIARRDKKILERIARIISRFMRIILFSPNNKLKRIRVLLKGSFTGFFFNPKIEY